MRWYIVSLTPWGGTRSDLSSWRFGVREVTSVLQDNGHRLYLVNGQNILIRGGGYARAHPHVRALCKHMPI